MDSLTESVRQFRRLDEATLSANVPPIADHDPIPIPIRTTHRQTSIVDYRFDSKRSILPQPRDAEWEVPVFTGGADWERRPLWTVHDMPGPSDGYSAIDPRNSRDPGRMTDANGRWLPNVSDPLSAMTPVRAAEDEEADEEEAVAEQTTSPGLGSTIAGGVPPKHATTTASIGLRATSGLPFYGRRGLRTIEKERQTRMRKAKKKPGSEWEVPVQVGGVNLLRRTPLITR